MTRSRSTKRCSLTSSTRPAAFTLLELIVVLAIVSLLAAVAVPSAARALRGTTPTRSLQEVQSTLALARAQALREARPVEVSITIETASIAIGWADHRRTIAASWISSPREHSGPSRVEFDSVGLASVQALNFREKWEPADILWSLPFDPISGSVGRPAREETTP